VTPRWDDSVASRSSPRVTAIRSGLATCRTIDQFAGLQYLPVWLAALAAIVIGVRCGYRVVLILAGAVVLWVVVERLCAARLPCPAAVHVRGRRGGGGAHRHRHRIAGEFGRRVCLQVSAGAIVDRGICREMRSIARQDAYELRNSGIQATIKTLGWYRAVRACGKPVTDVAYASVLAWLTHLDVGHVGDKPGREIRSGSPIVVFMPVSGGGWQVRPWHTPSAQRVSCSAAFARRDGAH